jgi:hypothetical protein
LGQFFHQGKHLRLPVLFFKHKIQFFGDKGRGRIRASQDASDRRVTNNQIQFSPFSSYLAE